MERNHQGENLVEVAKEVLKKAEDLGFETLLDKQKKSWAEIWEMSDITIEGDVKHNKVSALIFYS